jgi:hypothetical protein
VVVGGVHARQDDERFFVAMAVIDDDRVLGHSVVPAAAGEPESRRLRELQVRAHELLRSTSAEALVVWQVDPPPKGRGIRLLPALTVGRAEGAVLAAAGELGIETIDVQFSGAAVRGVAGKGTTTDEAVEKLCGQLQDVPDIDTVRRAVAVARAWVMRGGTSAPPRRPRRTARKRSRS